MLEFRGFKLDILALTGLIGVVGGLYMQIKGANKRKQKKEDDNAEK